jgi:hypothetical protein
MAYPLGWSAIPQMLVRRERWPGGYRAKGIPLVAPSQEVRPEQPVLRMEHENREVTEAVGSAPWFSSPSVGYQANVMQEVASANGVRTETVPAGLYGRVVDITPRGGVVIESWAAIVQGVIGAGNQIVGLLTVWQGGTGQAIPPGAILVVPGPVNLLMLQRAMSSGVTGVIASSISAGDLEGFLATDLIQLLNRIDVEQAHLPPMTLLFTEGVGTFSMPARVMNLLSQYQGSIALLSGITSIRQGIFPDLVISQPSQRAQTQWNPLQLSTALTLGAQVRISSGEREGAIGEVDYLFAQQQVFAAGIRARAVRLRLEDGSIIVVPITLVERIG